MYDCLISIQILILSFYLPNHRQVEFNHNNVLSPQSIEMVICVSVLRLLLLLSLFCMFCSSLSVWVHNCDSLDLAESKRSDLDALIDQLYEAIDRADRTYAEDGMEGGMLQ